MNGNLVEQSLRLGISVLITCAIAQHFDRINFAWYPVLAVIFIVNDQDKNTLRAARGRILGTVTEGGVGRFSSSHASIRLDRNFDQSSHYRSLASAPRLDQRLVDCCCDHCDVFRDP